MGAWAHPWCWRSSPILGRANDAQLTAQCSLPPAPDSSTHNLPSGALAPVRHPTLLHARGRQPLLQGCRARCEQSAVMGPPSPPSAPPGSDPSVQPHSVTCTAGMPTCAHRHRSLHTIACITQARPRCSAAAQTQVRGSAANIRVCHATTPPPPGLTHCWLQRERGVAHTGRGQGRGLHPTSPGTLTTHVRPAAWCHARLTRSTSCALHIAAPRAAPYA